mmetsp:Transcript_31977/g.83920  ORF Transcript_31977/g.83920 Transcript_31977/m.83920 type:complete len:313 (-) Transcript_31977:349-1287(-)
MGARGLPRSQAPLPGRGSDERHHAEPFPHVRHAGGRVQAGRPAPVSRGGPRRGLPALSRHHCRDAAPQAGRRHRLLQPPVDELRRAGPGRGALRGHGLRARRVGRRGVALHPRVGGLPLHPAGQPRPAAERHQLALALRRLQPHLRRRDADVHAPGAGGDVGHGELPPPRLVSRRAAQLLGDQCPVGERLRLRRVRATAALGLDGGPRRGSRHLRGQLHLLLPQALQRPAVRQAAAGKRDAGLVLEAAPRSGDLTRRIGPGGAARRRAALLPSQHAAGPAGGGRVALGGRGRALWGLAAGVARALRAPRAPF